MSSRRKFLGQLAKAAGLVALAPFLGSARRPAYEIVETFEGSSDLYEYTHSWDSNPKGAALVAWLDEIRANHKDVKVLAGADIVDFFRAHNGALQHPIRYTERTGTINFTRFEIARYPVRYHKPGVIIEPFFNEAVRVSPVCLQSRSTVNPVWIAAKLELVWAFGGETVHACVIDRETMEIDHKPELIVNPAWQSAPLDMIYWSDIQDPTRFNV